VPISSPSSFLLHRVQAYVLRVARSVFRVSKFSWFSARGGLGFRCQQIQKLRDSGIEELTERTNEIRNTYIIVSLIPKFLNYFP
jgi:hypothetical protein